MDGEGVWSSKTTEEGEEAAGRADATPVKRREIKARLYCIAAVWLAALRLKDACVMD